MQIQLSILLVLSATALLSQDIPTLTTRVFEYSGEQPGDISNMCSLGCAIGWDLTTSSFLAAQGSNVYDANRIDDGHPSTAWIEGRKGLGIGEKITFHFPAHYFTEGHIKDSINFDGFRILNGYQKDSLTWLANSRVKRLRVYHNQEPICDILVSDSMLMQEVDDHPLCHIKPGDTITVQIREVFRGKRYEDTAISELIPLGAH